MGFVKFGLTFWLTLFVAAKVGFGPPKQMYPLRTYRRRQHQRTPLLRAGLARRHLAEISLR